MYGVTLPGGEPEGWPVLESQASFETQAMNILGNLFGSLTSGLIRLAVAAGILFLCYLFIVKPVLKTTDEAIKSSGLQDIGKTLDLGEIGKTFNSVNHEVQREIRKAFKTTGGHKRRKRLIRCINRSHGNVRRIERCTRRF
jgi:hypothetical protein